MQTNRAFAVEIEFGLWIQLERSLIVAVHWF